MYVCIPVHIVTLPLKARPMYFTFSLLIFYIGKPGYTGRYPIIISIQSKLRESEQQNSGELGFLPLLLINSPPNFEGYFCSF